MQKKIIALAIAGLASSAAFAADNVTIYGRMDYGYVNQGGNGGAVNGVDNKSSLASGVQSGSRIGFKGAEDLGNGLKAIFEAEFGISGDQAGAATSAATWTNRHSYVGLTGGFGTVVGGRVDGARYGLFNKYDAFAGGTVGNFTQMTAQVDRADNAIAYISPNFNGFTATLAYATNIAGAEAGGFTGSPALAVPVYTKGNANDNRLNTIMLQYENGPISLSADYETVTSVNSSNTVAAPDNKTTVYTLAGSYDLGVVKLSALWDNHKVENRTTSLTTTDYRDWFISAKAPIAGTKFAVKATYGRIDDKTAADADANKFGLGMDYSLSKRTTIYADYGRISNNSNGFYQVSQAANSAFGANGNGVHAFDLGIAHNF